MTREAIEIAVAEARELIRRADAALADRGTYEVAGHTLPIGPSPREMGALRRQSMELTRALAAMRKP